MPLIRIDATDLRAFGSTWQSNGESLSRKPPNSSSQFAMFFDRAVATALAKFLGRIPINEVGWRTLLPPTTDCVEVGQVRIVGGVRPQAFDVGYRPDGPRLLFDSKTLNDLKSVRKNWQNMINDLATEATTAHSRFPFAIVGFLIAIPEPCIPERQYAPLKETLERMAGRTGTEEQPHLAEAISLVIWDPATGQISSTMPPEDSPLRLQKFGEAVEQVYLARYKGLPPHD